MLNVKSRLGAKGGEQARRYYEEHLARDHYYAEKGSTFGIWYGKTAEMLGLAPGTKVDGEIFANLIDGRAPNGGKLTQRTKEKRIAYYDVVLSAPKAVSILAIVGRDERLMAAHEEAARETMKFAEGLIKTRVRKGVFAKTNETRTTGNILAASFLHQTSRALDPQLHTHFITLNVTHDLVENQYKALYARAFYEGYDLFLQIYRNSLAKKMRELGYEVDKSGNAFRVKGISAELEKRFSKRSMRIREVEAELKERGVTLSNDGRAILARITREKKKILTPDELLVFQRAQLSPEELKMVLSVIENATHENREPGPMTAEQWLELAKSAERRVAAVSSELIEKAVNDVFQRVTVASEEQLMAKALEFCTDGEFSIEALREELRSARYIRINGLVTTKEAQRREARLIRFASQRHATPLPTLGNKKGLRGLSFTQKLAAGTVLSSHDTVTILRGLAGTGKTTTLSEIIRNLNLPPEALTYVVAPSTSAVQTLQEELSERLPLELRERRTKVQTMQRLLISAPDQRMLKDGVLIVDEAGLASNKDIEGLFQIAKNQNCRVLLVGDQKQHQSVEAGDALRILMKHATCTKAKLWKIRRQADEYKQVIRAIDKGKVAESWELLARGWVVAGSDDPTRRSMISQEPDALARAERVSEHYLKLTDKPIDGKKQSVLIITPTWDEHARISDALREKLKERGDIEKAEHKLTVLRSQIFTDEQKKHHGYYENGQVLLVHRRVRSLKKGDQLTVLSVEGKYLKVQKQDGKVFTVNPEKIGPNCEVMRKNECMFSVGDQIMLQANFNHGRTHLANGSVHKIHEIRENGEIVLEKSRVLPATYRTFVHGYATTSHKSQSKTVDFAILSADARQAGALSTRQWLVSLSRGRKAVYVYTNDVNKLYKASHMKGDRLSAHELLSQKLWGREALGKMKKLLKRLPAARDWLQHQKDSVRMRKRAGREKVSTIVAEKERQL